MIIRNCNTMIIGQKRSSKCYCRFMPILPKKARLRLVIYASDVEAMTGRSPRTARKMLQDIRKKNNKSKTAFVTVREFAEHSGIDEESIRGFLAS